MTDTSDSLRATWNAWKPWAYPYAETGLCEMCGEIDGHRTVDEGMPTERPCLVGAFETALARLKAADRLADAGDLAAKAFRGNWAIDWNVIEDAVAAYRAANAPERPTPCIWTRNDDGDWTYWEAACDNAFSFEDGDPDENYYRYCPACGRPVLLVPTIQDVEVEDVGSPRTAGTGGDVRQMRRVEALEVIESARLQNASRVIARLNCGHFVESWPGQSVGALRRCRACEANQDEKICRCGHKALLHTIQCDGCGCPLSYQQVVRP